MQSKLNKFTWVGVGVAIGVIISLNFSAIANKEPAASLPIEDLRAFAEVFGRIKSNYVEQVPDKKLIREAIQGMVSGLDPHSVYLDEDSFKELQVQTQGQFGGLGIEVNQEDGLIKVVSPIEDTPAYRAGIKSGDLIVKIDDTFVKGLGLEKAIKRMRGEPGTKVTLTIWRKGEEKEQIFTLERAIVKPQSVKGKLLEPGYAWLRIVQFQEHTVEDMVRKLQELYKDGPLKGLVLDLRDDPGGVLHGAVGVSAAFLPQDALVVYTEGRTADAKMQLTANQQHYGKNVVGLLKSLPEALKTLPLVVLVNGGSASASEIVAGALQDHKRAVVLGTRTFGKGSVQSILPLGNDTAIKLTTARYFTPNGRSIHGKGLEPDTVIEQESTDGGIEPQRINEAELERHLDRIRGKEVDEPSKDPSKTKFQEKSNEEKQERDTRARTKPFDYGGDKDFQLLQAMNQLKGLLVVSQQAKGLANTAEGKDTAKPN